MIFKRLAKCANLSEGDECQINDETMGMCFQFGCGDFAKNLCLTQDEKNMMDSIKMAAKEACSNLEENAECKVQIGGETKDGSCKKPKWANCGDEMELHCRPMMHSG